MPIKSRIRTIPDHPKKGIQFRDITTLLKDPKGLKLSIDALFEQYKNSHIDKIAGIEARGFILGTPLAYLLDVGFIPIRKQGKLPADTVQQTYDLEYGSDCLEIHLDAIAEGERVLIIDDLLATGGTATAAIQLVERMGGMVVACAFVIDLPDIGGNERLKSQGHTPFSLCSFEGE